MHVALHCQQTLNKYIIKYVKLQRNLTVEQQILTNKSKQENLTNSEH